jgi:hypothetical protein
MNEREVFKSVDRRNELKLARGGGVLLHEPAPLTAWTLDLEALRNAKLLQ